MKTADLIERLADSPASARNAAAMLSTGAIAGALIALTGMLAWLGLRPDLAEAAGTWGYWVKFTYTLALALLLFRTVERLTRPAVTLRLWMDAVPLAAVAAIALLQWTTTPSAEHGALLMGQSSLQCPWRIVTLSLPLLAGTLWGMRQLAPTRLMLAGAAAGCFAGAAGAWIYAFACTESSAVFVAVWYTLGIALTGLLGALIGRWALRW
jgi:hypothetical protein